jgi:hypothetical protein
VQVAWVLEHLADLASDFSAIHGIRDMLSLPGPVFFALAYRLSAYQGVMAARAAEREDAPEAPGEPERRTALPEQVTPRVVLQTDPAFKGIFSFGGMATA